MPISTTQREEVRALLASGSSNQDIAAQIGISIGQVAAVKAHMTMGTYGGGSASAPDTETEIANAIDASFGLERDLQLALRRNIQQLETGLSIIDGDREQTVPSGRIDITARDERGITVLIELKVGLADRDAVGQILSYVGDVLNREPSVRGILVAGEFSARAIAAARAAPNIRLIQYGFRFTFETIASTSRSETQRSTI